MVSRMGEALTMQVQESAAELIELAVVAPLTGLRIRLTGRRPDLEEGGADAPWRTTLVVEAGRAAPAPGDDLRLTDPELVPFAVLSDISVRAETDGELAVTGDLAALTPRTSQTFPELDLHGLPGELAGADVVVTDRLLLTNDVEALRRLAIRDRPTVLLGLVGEGRPVPREPLVRALRAVAEAEAALDLDVRLLVLPADRLGGGHLLAGLLQQMGAAEVWRADPLDGSSAADSSALPPLPSAGPAVPWRELVAGLHRGGALPDGVAPPAVAVELRRLHPAALGRGVVLLFTGLSGSGKSTVAAGAVAALRTEGSRRVTVLDGDRVRTMLSSGLSFSKEDRELNVRRIGFVAAEVARHGGTAVCAPIAPYASTRADVRGMVEEAGGIFLLLHVATPLEVCEARDRKGLYARARAGTLPSFTGISDPYEEPEDADLRIDTSTTSLEDCVADVVSLLRGRGLMPPDQD